MWLFPYISFIYHFGFKLWEYIAYTKVFTKLKLLLCYWVKTNKQKNTHTQKRAFFHLPSLEAD